MLTVEEIKQKKKEYGFSNQQVAKLSGVPLGTVQKVLGNVTRSPRVETLMAISRIFESSPQISAYAQDLTTCFHGSPDYNNICYTADSMPCCHSSLDYNTHYYDRQGTYTLSDYLALPSDQRVELIDGYIYDMGAPTSYHQLMAGEIFAEIRDFIKKKKGTCVPFMAPTDVQLDCDNRTMVEPDVMIVCDRSKITGKRVIGAPDFVAELLSPSTRHKDILIKSFKFQNAGVKEYWMVDQKEHKVMVYDFREEVTIKIYTFEDKIPVSIYNGELVIDMKEISDYLAFAEM